MENHTHIVQEGENLSSIAKKFGFKSADELYLYKGNKSLQVNRPDPNVIQPKDVVKIPENPIDKLDRLIEHAENLLTALKETKDNLRRQASGDAEVHKYLKEIAKIGFRTTMVLAELGFAAAAGAASGAAAGAASGAAAASAGVSLALYVAEDLLNQAVDTGKDYQGIGTISATNAGFVLDSVKAANQGGRKVAIWLAQYAAKLGSWAVDMPSDSVDFILHHTAGSGSQIEGVEDESLAQIISGGTGIEKKLLNKIQRLRREKDELIKAGYSRGSVPRA